MAYSHLGAEWTDEGAGIEEASWSLSERQYETGEQLKEAIDGAITEVKKLTGSGNVTDMGEVESGTEETESLEEREQRRKDAFNEIMQEVGLKEV